MKLAAGEQLCRRSPENSLILSFVSEVMNTDHKAPPYVVSSAPAITCPI